MNLTKYYYIGKINFVNSFVYVWDRVASSAFVGLIIFIFTQLWQIIYSEGQIISGFSIAMMLWYFVMTESIVTSLPSIVKRVGAEIKEGQIANYLNKPYNYLLYQYSTYLGKAVFNFFLTFLIGSIVVLPILGGIEFNFLNIPLIFLAVILAISLNFILMMFLGMFSFWFEESGSLRMIYNKIVFTLGGMLLPLEIFPQWLSKISKLLPFSYIAYYPAKLFVNFNFGLFWQVIRTQIFWIVIFSGLTLMMYKIGVRKVSINGG